MQKMMLSLLLRLPLLILCLNRLVFAIDYSYNGLRGPGHWGELESGWKECSHGKLQSPIPIQSRRALSNTSLHRLEAHYQQQSICSVSASQFIFKVFVSGSRCTLPLGKSTYMLTDFHFHAPSEHTLDGTRFPLELHLVHKVARNSSQIAVVSKLFRLGKRDRLLNQILKNKGQNSTMKISDFIDVRGGYFRYIGSLTTPPCSEGIVWTLLRQSGTVSRGQIKMVMNLMQGRNARPLQKTNNRAIYKHES